MSKPLTWGSLQSWEKISAYRSNSCLTLLFKSVIVWALQCGGAKGYLASASDPVSGFLLCSLCEVDVKKEASEMWDLQYSERGGWLFWWKDRKLPSWPRTDVFFSFSTTNIKFHTKSKPKQNYVKDRIGYNRTVWPFCWAYFPCR